jgi:hypothetical protein
MIGDRRVTQNHQIEQAMPDKPDDLTEEPLWGWQIDKIAPDRFDLIGGFIALLGVLIVMYWPRP